MRNLRYILIPLLTLLPCSSLAVECGVEKARYADLNRPLRVSYAGEKAYLSIREAQTDKLHAFTVSKILNQLNTGAGSHSGQMISYIRCLQSVVPENAITANLTNLPAVFTLSSEPFAVALGYEVFRGWGAVPDDRYYFDVFHKRGEEWYLSSSIGSSFDGSTLFVHPISTGKAGQDWFLFSGSPFGNTGGFLHLEVVSYDGKALKSVWRSDMRRTSLEGAFGDHIVVSGEGQDKKGHYFEFKNRFDVVPSGLKEVSSQVTH